MSPQDIFNNDPHYLRYGQKLVLVPRFSLLQQPSSRVAIEQLGVATIEPKQLDRAVLGLVANLEQVHVAFDDDSDHPAGLGARR